MLLSTASNVMNWRVTNLGKTYLCNHWASKLNHSEKLRALARRLRNHWHHLDQFYERYGCRALRICLARSDASARCIADFTSVKSLCLPDVVAAANERD